MKKNFALIFTLSMILITITSCYSAKKLCADFTSGNKSKQEKAAKELGEMDKKDVEKLSKNELDDVIDCVLVGLGDDDEGVRAATYSSLNLIITEKVIDSETSVGYLLEAITAINDNQNKYNQYVRGFSIDLLGVMKQDAGDAMETLILTMGENELSDRSVQALSKIIAGKNILEGVNKLEIALKTELAKLTADLNAKIPDNLNQNIVGGSIQIINSVGSEAVQTTDELIQILETPAFGSDLRNNAISALGSIGEIAKDSISPLIGALRESELKSKSIYALTEIIVNDNVADGVNNLENALSVELAKLPEDTHEKIPAEVYLGIIDGTMQVLANIGSKAVQTSDELIRVLEGTTFAANLHNQAATTLGNNGEGAFQAIGALISALGKEELHEKSAEALEKIIVADNIAAGVDQLEIVLNAELAKLPEDVTDTLPDELNLFLIEGATQIISGIGPKAVQAIDELIQILEKPAFDSELRNKAAFALGNIGEAAVDAIDALILTLNEGDLHGNSLEALKSIFIRNNITSKNIKKFEEALIDNEDIVGAINILKDSENATWQLREMAAKALKDIGGGDTDATNALISAFGDPNDLVQKAAGGTLESFINDDGTPTSDQTIVALVIALGNETHRPRSQALLKSISPNMPHALEKTVETLIDAHINDKVGDEAKNLMVDKTLHNEYQNAIIEGLLASLSKGNPDFNMHVPVENEDKIIDVFKNMTGVTDKLLKIMNNDVANLRYRSEICEAAAWVLARNAKDGTKIIPEYVKIINLGEFNGTITEALGLFVLSDSENEA